MFKRQECVASWGLLGREGLVEPRLELALVDALRVDAANVDDGLGPVD